MKMRTVESYSNQLTINSFMYGTKFRYIIIIYIYIIIVPLIICLKINTSFCIYMHTDKLVCVLIE